MPCDDPSNILVAILAAGASRRLGQAKQLVRLDDEPLLRRQCRVAVEAAIGPVVAVLGHAADACAATIHDLPVAIHVNDQWPEGLASSLRTATRAAMGDGAGALLVLHGDQYRITPADLRSLHEAWRAAPDLAHLSASGEDYLGPPTVLPAAIFPTLLTLTGDRGARGVLGAEQSTWRRHPIRNARFDLDEPGQLEQLHER